jgi:hypothetical protein
MAKKEATPLSVMLGSGEDFYFDITKVKVDSEGNPVFDEQGEPILEVVATKKLKVLPLKLKELDEFTEDRVSIGTQLFTTLNDSDKAKADKWLKTHVFLPGSGKVVTVDLLKEEGMDLIQLRRLIGKLIDISG